MPNYRRARVHGGTYFFTLVTHQRRPVFESDVARSILGGCFREASQQWPMSVEAIVLLPEHLHAIWRLPPGDAGYSARWAWIKKEFTKRWLKVSKDEAAVSGSRDRERRRGIWQPRFWEHTIRDEDDFDRHFDYIHFNPVNHGLVGCPADWPHSSFHRWVRRGVYDRDWACSHRGRSLPDFSGLEESVGE